MKKFRKFVAGKKAAEAKAIVPEIYKALDKAAKRNYIKKNTASRLKSRVAAALKKISK